MKLLFYKIYSPVGWIGMISSCIIYTPFFLLVWLFTFWWDRRGITIHYMTTFWAWILQGVIPFWKLEIEGRKKIPLDRPVILVSNHRSKVDILALSKIRRPFKWTSKSENFKLPFVGMALTLYQVYSHKSRVAPIGC